MVALPNDTQGYQRQAMAMLAGTTAANANPATAAQGYAVQLFSKAMGHLGGNDITAEFVAGPPGSALSRDRRRQAPHGVSWRPTPKARRRARPRRSATRSTPTPGASALVTAYLVQRQRGRGHRPGACAGDSSPTTWPRRRTSSAVRSTSASCASASSATAPRPACSSTASSTRVSGSPRSRAWRRPSGSCATTPRIRRPRPTSTTSTSSSCRRSNPDGGHYSFYDFGSKRRNMSNYCPPGRTSGNVGNRNNWGVDLNRNSSVGSVLRRLLRRVGDRARATRSRPVRALRAGDPQREVGRRQRSRRSSSRSTSTRTAATSCGPRARTAPTRARRCRRRTSASRTTSSRCRRRSCRTSRTRATRCSCRIARARSSDTLYSAAGNSVDEQWYNQGIIAYLFEAGAQRIVGEPDTGAIQRRDVGFQPCFGGPGTSGSHGHDLRHGRQPGRADGQRGSRPGDGVRRRQLRPAAGRPGVLAGRHGAGHEHRVQRRADRRRPDQLPLQVARRGGGHPLHDGRLDADAESPKYESQGMRRPARC